MHLSNYDLVALVASDWLIFDPRACRKLCSTLDFLVSFGLKCFYVWTTLVGVSGQSTHFMSARTIVGIGIPVRIPVCSTLLQLANLKGLMLIGVSPTFFVCQVGIQEFARAS